MASKSSIFGSYQSGGKSSDYKEDLKKTDVLGIDPILSDPLGLWDTLGFGTPGASNVADPRFLSGGSSITKAGVNVDPNILASRERGLGMVDESLRNVQGSRIGDPQAFMEKRLDPLRKGIGEQQAALTERQQKTGLEGSEFGKQTQENFRATANQKLEQGEALAFNEVMSVMSQLDQSEGGLLRLQEQLKSSEFAQDAQARGMSRQLLSSLTDIDLTERGIREGQASTARSQTGTVVSMIASIFSSRSFKGGMKSVDNQKILKDMMELSVEKWKYTGEDKEYIGCYAEDFNEKFGEKGDLTINAVDIIGVLMASIQAQQEQIEELKQCLTH